MSTTNIKMTRAMIRACKQLDGAAGYLYVQRLHCTAAQVMDRYSGVVFPRTVVTRSVLSQLVNRGYLYVVDSAHLPKRCVRAWGRTDKAVES